MRVVSWNTEGRLSRFSKANGRGSPEEIVEEISRLDGDIVVLPEAFDGAKPIEPSVRLRLGKLGYQSITVAYSECGSRQYQANVDPQMMLLSRYDIVRFEELWLGGIRTMAVADIVEPSGGQTIRVFGIHLDDRNEVNRLKQVEDLEAYINESPYPVIAMGDFNAMYSSSLQARVLRNSVVRFGIDHFPHASTKDILQRLSEMAVGDTMSRLERFTDLQPGDPSGRPTITPKMRDREWLPSIALVQIDHILTSPQLKVDDFEVARDGGSDHRAISATVSVARQND